MGNFFTHHDRLYYFDRVGGSKWHSTKTRKPSSAVADAWKAGIQSTVNPNIARSEGGAKEGFYRTVMVKKNSDTEAISTYPDPQAAAVETRASGGTYGGLTLNSANWATAKAADTAYEWDRVSILCTMGNTEVRFDAETPTYLFYTDVEVDHDQEAAPSLSRADHAIYAHNHGRSFANAGGVPPGCLHAACNGSRAVYGGVYSGAALVPGQIMYSLDGYPAMVPGDQDYTVADSTTVQPRPWKGFLNSAISGVITGIECVRDRFIVFTQTHNFWLSPVSSGRLVARNSWVTGGCLSHTGSVTTAHGAHAIGRDCWMFASEKGLADIAPDRFVKLLQEIPSAQRTATVAGKFPARHEVWMAVARENFDCDYIMVHDGAAATNEAVADSADNDNFTYAFQLFSDTAHASDIAYFGWTAATATTLTLAVNRPAVYDSTAHWTWEYYDEDETDWVALTISADTTDPDNSDGSESFKDDGKLTFSISGTWGSSTVNEQAAYWIRCKPATDKATRITQTPILTPTGPSRILVFDEARGELMTKYDPRNLCGATIKAMVELVTPSEGPLMLVGLSDGRILSWPSASFVDTDDDGTYNYSTYWRGFFGQERRLRDMQIAGVGIHMGDNDSGLTVAAAGVRTGADTHTTAIEITATQTNEAVEPSVEFDPNMHGNLFQLTLSTDVSTADDAEGNTPGWELDDLILKLQTTD